MKRSMMLALGILVVTALVATSLAVQAAAKADPVTVQGAVEITWQHPKKFRDIKSSAELQSRFETRLFNSLTQALNKTASKSLKPNQKLYLLVTDVDLAGDMRPTFGASANDLRIVKDIFPPRLCFSYQLMEGEQVLIAGDEKLTNLSFLQQLRPVSSRTFLHETRLLTHWFEHEIAPRL